MIKILFIFIFRNVIKEIC